MIQQSHSGSEIEVWGIERACWSRGLRSLAGVDEAGRGPLAGPVVAAAVTIPYALCHDMPRCLMSLNDSKQLSEQEREELVGAMAELRIPFGIGVVSNDEIDRINILQATMRAMTLAVESLSQRLATDGLKIEMLLVDGNYFRTALSYPFETFVKGDGRSRHIAAASIVAKVTRDRIMRAMHDRYPQYNFARHKGYATEEHRRAIRIHGLSPVHRMSFHSSVIQSSDLFAEQ